MAAAKEAEAALLSQRADTYNGKWHWQGSGGGGGDGDVGVGTWTQQQHLVAAGRSREQ